MLSGSALGGNTAGPHPSIASCAHEARVQADAFREAPGAAFSGTISSRTMGGLVSELSVHVRIGVKRCAGPESLVSTNTRFRGGPSAKWQQYHLAE